MVRTGHGGLGGRSSAVTLVTLMHIGTHCLGDELYIERLYLRNGCSYNK